MRRPEPAGEDRILGPLYLYRCADCCDAVICHEGGRPGGWRVIRGEWYCERCGKKRKRVREPGEEG